MRKKSKNKKTKTTKETKSKPKTQSKIIKKQLPVLNKKEYPSFKILDEKEIALDFATKLYKKFDKLIKSVVLFGSTVKKTATSGSDIDLIIIVDDASVRFDQELISWYRQELGKLIKLNPYQKELHINTVRLTTWWQDLLKGDPIVINIIRYGEPILDFGGYFTPLRVLLEQGKIKSTPEAIYTSLERAPQHLARSKFAETSAIEGVYWAMVDAAHALLITAKILPPSPEHIPGLLKEHFVNKKMLDMKYVLWYRDVYLLHRKIIHGEVRDIKGQDLDKWQDYAEEFIEIVAKLINELITKK